MPLYIHRCTNGHEHEVLQKVDQRDLPEVCPECGCMSRMIPATAGSIKFGVPGVKGHYTTQADGGGTRC